MELHILHSVNFSKEELKWSLFDHKVQLTQLDLCTGDPRCDSSRPEQLSELRFSRNLETSDIRCQHSTQMQLHYAQMHPFHWSSLQTKFGTRVRTAPLLAIDYIVASDDACRLYTL